MIHATCRVLALAIVLCCVPGARSFAQGTATAEERLLRSDPQELVESEGDDQRTVRTSLADLEEKDIRVAPASVQVITARQIRASGARNLLDVLQTLPGLSFGRDVDDVIGVGIHGNWAEEGKCLFLLNGFQLNENDFGSYSIGNRIPLENVDRIEVITGPGSVVHGGYAALGVINIITRNSQETHGGQATASTGVTSNGITRTNVGISGNQSLGKQKEIEYMLNMDRGTRSNAVSLLPDGRTISFGDSTQGQCASFQFSYRWKEMAASVMYLDEAFEVSDGRYSVHMRDVILGLEDHRRISSVLGISWKLNHTEQIPWYYENTGDPERLASNTSNNRSSASVVLSAKPKEWFGVRLGLQAFTQGSEYYTRDEGVVFSMNDERNVRMNDVAGFAEITLKGKPGSLSAAYRYEYNSLSGQYLAPRLSYAKVFGRFHTKLLYSKAFKTPTVMNLNYGPVDGSVVAEYTTTGEVELGFRPGKVWQITANGYHTTLQDPIVYVYDAATLDNYLNRPFSGTMGVDARFQLQSDRVTVQLGYGRYRALEESDIPEAQLPAPYERTFQALPNQRMTLVAGWDVAPSLFLHGRAIHVSKKWSYQYVSEAQDSLALFSWPQELMLAAGVTWRPAKLNRLELDLGCANILDTQRVILSPYNNGSLPITLNGRELTFKVLYRFSE